MDERVCLCSDPENCTQRVPGYRCKKDFMPTASLSSNHQVCAELAVKQDDTIDSLRARVAELETVVRAQNDGDCIGDPKWPRSAHETSEGYSQEYADQMRTALLRIQQWDCLNPPRADLLGDLPWLRRTVDAALLPVGRAVKASAPPSIDKLACEHCGQPLDAHLQPGLVCPEKTSDV